MKDEYINKHAAIIEMMDNDVDHAQGTDGREVVQILEDISAANVVPVTHGKWIENSIPDSMLKMCSNCGFTCGAYSFNYCPNCGAKMDGGKTMTENLPDTNVGNIEYIRKEDAIEEIRKAENHAFNSFYKGLVKAHKIVADLPPADVVPVVHGEWIRSGAEGHIICNKCGYEAKYTIVERQDATGKWTSRFAQDIKTNFCPNCGAKMDGGKNT